MLLHHRNERLMTWIMKCSLAMGVSRTYILERHTVIYSKFKPLGTSNLTFTANSIFIAMAIKLEFAVNVINLRYQVVWMHVNSQTDQQPWQSITQTIRGIKRGPTVWNWDNRAVKIPSISPDAKNVCFREQMMTIWAIEVLTIQYKFKNSRILSLVHGHISFPPAINTRQIKVSSLMKKLEIFC